MKCCQSHFQLMVVGGTGGFGVSGEMKGYELDSNRKERLHFTTRDDFCVACAW